jgi:transposase
MIAHPEAGNYSIKQIAIGLKIHPATVGSWIRRKWLKATFDKQRKLVAKEDLKKFLENPPNSRTRGLIYLLDKDSIKRLFNE